MENHVFAIQTDAGVLLPSARPCSAELSPPALGQPGSRGSPSEDEGGDRVDRAPAPSPSTALVGGFPDEPELPAWLSVSPQGHGFLPGRLRDPGPGGAAPPGSVTNKNTTGCRRR